MVESTHYGLVIGAAGFISSNFILAAHYLRTIVRFAAKGRVGRSIDALGEITLTNNMVCTCTLLDEARRAALKIRPKASILRPVA